MTHICPSCGYSLDRDEVIEADGFTLDPRGVVRFDGRDLPVTKGEAGIIYSIARADGRPLTASVLLQRCTEGETENNVTALLCKARRKLYSIGVQIPIRTVPGRKGYRWEGRR